MFKDHKTKEEAIREFETYPLDTEKFCPIISGECRLDCICLIEGCVVEINAASMRKNIYKWRSRSPYCTHTLITGEINI